MFTGHCTNSINNKGRLSIPARFREVLESGGGDHLVVAKGLDRCLTAYSPDEWESVKEKAVRLSNVKKATVFYKRHVIGSAEECVLDAQGRILIPSNLREYAGLHKKCQCVGLTSRFEIWDQETYDNEMMEAFNGTEDVREDLAEQGL
ncbi:MAG: division/cell wall cluster transcriptional repressor MraZ [Thermodesulfobacteriota bacterium]|nr:division/cell wall cluster transcriptional repressor MraZ [Thermodesulfobacteriota bacterium]